MLEFANPKRAKLHLAVTSRQAATNRMTSVCIAHSSFKMRAPTTLASTRLLSPVLLRCLLRYLLALLLLLSSFISHGVHAATLAESLADKQALLSLRAALDNAKSNVQLFDSNGWMASPNSTVGPSSYLPCKDNWGLIVCDDDGRVSAIVIKPEMNYDTFQPLSPPMTGHIPWGNMTALLSHLTNLTINQQLLSDAPSLSEAMGQFTRLEILDFYEAKMLGTIPRSITALKRLRTLIFSGNRITGELPPNLDSLAALEYVTLTNCRLRGPLPELPSLKRLQTLSLVGNFFEGSVPASWGNLTSLELLNLGSLPISGSLPDSLSNLVSLKELITANSDDIVSPFPHYVTRWTNLRSLRINSCQFYGTLPPNLWSLKNLGTLDISTNFLNGTMPLPPWSRRTQMSLMYMQNCFNSTSTGEGPLRRFGPTCSNFYNRLFPVPPPPPQPSPPVPVTVEMAPPASSSSSSAAIIGGIVAGVIALLALAILCFLYWQYRSGRVLRKLHKGLNQLTREYSVKELKAATKNWTTVIGKGGYGTVFKAKLKDGQVVAVKRMETLTEQGDVEFIREVELLSRVHHRHLVNLLGFCAEKGERALVYEYMGLGSIHDLLHGDRGKQLQLAWEDRIKMAIHVALGIEYLHYGADPPLIHRDIKSANILLSDDGYSKVADFGLCKEAPMGINSDGEAHVAPTNTEVRGSFGYLDPEYVNTSILSEKSDVYSYGVVLLELISGHKSIHEWQPLAYWAEEYLKDPEKMPLLLDPRIGKDYDIEQLYILCDIARNCVQDRAANRPTIRDVAQALVENLGHVGSSQASSSQGGYETSSTTDYSSINSASDYSYYNPEEFSYRNFSSALNLRGQREGEEIDDATLAPDDYLSKKREVEMDGVEGTLGDTEETHLKKQSGDDAV